MSTSLPIVASASDIPTSKGFDLVGMLLAEQQSLTAVERFSSWHEQAEAELDHSVAHSTGNRGVSCEAEPAQARYYRSLLPATAPAPGQQYAFDVDLDSCSGCKACVVACHTLNGLDDDESWRRVGTIMIGDGPNSRVGHVTTACHHCEDPGCLKGCPVKAYDKDPTTGIVRHLDDQCIGCKYCTMMCPYEVPQYSDRLGIVRKCDMCHQRLSVGEAPACVQSCPNEAISIKVVSAGTPIAADQRLSPQAPLSQLTRPTTHYHTEHRERFQTALPQDVGLDEPAESHWPLAAMLIATEVSVGMLLAERMAAAMLWLGGDAMPMEATRWTALAALLIGLVGMNLAPLHLGQPLRAWRVFLGLRTSWLSREAVVLGKYVGALVAATALLWMPVMGDLIPSAITSRIPTWAAAVTLWAALVLGAAGLVSSAMIYIATKRQLWRYGRTLPRFLGTAVVAGAAGVAPAMVHGGAPTALVATTLLTALLLLIAKLDWEYRILLGATATNEDSLDRRSRRLVQDELPRLRIGRIRCAWAAIGLIAVGSIAVWFGSVTPAVVLLTLAAAAIVAGEACERLLYFMSVVYDRMPGTLR